MTLIERLRYWASDGHPHGLLHREAADTIERLNKENERLTSALERAGDIFEAIKEQADDDETLLCWQSAKEGVELIDAALAARAAQASAKEGQED